jgi:hypothetical protein
MKICRFNDDRLGIVVGGLVHDVTDLQTEIRSSLNLQIFIAVPQ